MVASIIAEVLGECQTDHGALRSSSDAFDETSLLRASRRGGYVLRPPGGPVDLDRYPARGGPRFHQFERNVRAGIGEKPRALADDHRADEQVDLVDKLVVEQCDRTAPSGAICT